MAGRRVDEPRGLAPGRAHDRALEALGRCVELRRFREAVTETVAEQNGNQIIREPKFFGNLPYRYYRACDIQYFWRCFTMNQ